MDWSFLPRIAASDVGLLERSYNGPIAMGDNAAPTPQTEQYYGIMDPGKYGLPTNAYNNFLNTGGDQDTLNYLYKSGEKEGTQITYKRDGDYYVPQVNGTQGWDTNADSSGAVGLNVAKVLATPFAVNALQSAGMLGQGAASPGTMTTYGMLDTSMALPGTQFVAGAAGPGTMTTYGVLDKSMALPGTQFVDGVSGVPSLLNKATGLLSNPNALKGLGMLGGALAGGATDSGSGGGPTPATQQPVPTMGQATPTFGTYGPTETERYMTQQYLPGLFGRGR
jgi:hypothetical protein